MAERVPSGRDLRATGYVVLVMVCTVVPIALAVALAPNDGTSPVNALTFLLFIGSSMHVASTAWFYSVAEVRAHMRRHPRRYLLVPALLVVGSATVGALLSERATRWALLAFFAWQFLHFQKQNLGVTALVAHARRLGAVTRPERFALMLAGSGGILGLLGHPDLLQLGLGRSSDVLFVAGAVLFTIAVFAGIIALDLRALRDRSYVSMYLLALVFFAPVFVFVSPYAAVAGLTIAHGLQYLLLMTMVASGGRATDRPVSLLVLLNVALFVGVALNVLSHQHGHGAGGQLLFGVFVGLSMSHFVIDAGLWRLREQFPRNFLRERLPYLLVADETAQFWQRTRKAAADLDRTSRR